MHAKQSRSPRRKPLAWLPLAAAAVFTGGAEVQVTIKNDRATTTSGCVAPTCLPCAAAAWGLGSLSSCFVLTPQTSGA
jgi:hypothetical protein